jgi:hypothetical protein
LVWHETLATTSVRDNKTRKRREREQAIITAERAVARASKELEDIRTNGGTQIESLTGKLYELDTAQSAAKEVFDGLRRRPATEYTDPEASSDRPDWLATVDRTLDVSIRHEVFQKSMRYWERRWILEAQRSKARK